MRRLPLAAALLLCALLPACAGAELFVISDPAMLDLAYIREGALVTNLNAPNDRGVIARYTGVDLGEPPQRVTATVRFDGGGAVALIATPSADWSLAGITQRSLHAVFTAGSYHFGFYENGVLADVLAGEYTLDLTGGTEYTVGFTISRDTLTLLLPNGKKDKKIDPRVQSLNGGHILFEHYLTPGDIAAHAAPAITGVHASGPSLPALDDDFQRADGLPIAAPSGHAYVQFRNE